ncbi:MAG: hypothetical protein ACUVRH_05165 [Candidatus Bipolaricaulia bacterium]
MDRTESAVLLFNEGFNCAQAVLLELLKWPENKEALRRCYRILRARRGPGT